MKLPHFMGAALVTLCASGASAADRQPAPNDDGDRLICTYEATTGSHLKKRVCATKRQREERAEQDRKRFGELRTRPEAAGHATKP